MNANTEIVGVGKLSFKLVSILASLKDISQTIRLYPILKKGIELPNNDWKFNILVKAIKDIKELISDFDFSTDISEALTEYVKNEDLINTLALYLTGNQISENYVTIDSAKNFVTSSNLESKILTKLRNETSDLYKKIKEIALSIIPDLDSYATINLLANTYTKDLVYSKSLTYDKDYIDENFISEDALNNYYRKNESDDLYELKGTSAIQVANYLDATPEVLELLVNLKTQLSENYILQILSYKSYIDNIFGKIETIIPQVIPGKAIRKTGEIVEYSGYSIYLFKVNPNELVNIYLDTRGGGSGINNACWGGFCNWDNGFELSNFDWLYDDPPNLQADEYEWNKNVPDNCNCVIMQSYSSRMIPIVKHKVLNENIINSLYNKIDNIETSLNELREEEKVPITKDGDFETALLNDTNSFYNENENYSVDVYQNLVPGLELEIVSTTLIAAPLYVICKLYSENIDTTNVSNLNSISSINPLPDENLGKLNRTNSYRITVPEGYTCLLINQYNNLSKVYKILKKFKDILTKETLYPIKCLRTNDDLIVVYNDGKDEYVYKFGPGMKNKTWTLCEVKLRKNVTSKFDISFTGDKSFFNLNTPSGGDMLGPVAIINNDGLHNSYWCGGNHTSTINNSVFTAYTIYHNVYYEDNGVERELPLNEIVYCNKVKLEVNNLIKCPNNNAEDKLTDLINEKLFITIDKNSAYVTVLHNYIYSDIILNWKIDTYYGMLSVFEGNTIHVYELNDETPISVSNGTTLYKIDHPNVYKFSLHRNSDNLNLDSEIDITYGIGDHSLIDNTRTYTGMIFYSAPNTIKCYHKLIANLPITPTTSYSWKGKYTWYEG